MQFLSKKKIQKPVESSFIIKHGYAYHLRNIETGKAMAWYQNLKSPWFDKMAEEKKWSEEKEEKRDQDEKGDNPTMKWSSEKTLMVEIKIVEDPQAPLHVGVGRLLIGFKTKKVWILAPMKFVFLVTLQFIEGPIVNTAQKKTMFWLKAFLWLLLSEDVKFTKGISPLPKTTFSRALLDARLMPKVPSC